MYKVIKLVYCHRYMSSTIWLVLMLNDDVELLLTVGLFIILEFMSGGSIYDFLHKQKGVFKLPALLKVAVDVSKGMNYLHQNNIIHRDLKAANLLMEENEASYLSACCCCEVLCLACPSYTEFCR